jgi:hypothetical protein
MSRPLSTQRRRGLRQRYSEERELSPAQVELLARAEQRSRECVPALRTVRSGGSGALSAERSSR